MAWRSERFEVRLGLDEALAMDELRERMQVRTRAQVIRRALAVLYEREILSAPAPERPVVARRLDASPCRHEPPLADCRICQTGRWAV